MHGSRAENAALVETIVHKLPNSSAEVWVCPPFVYLAELTRALAGSRISLGAQDVCAETQGAFTGEVSAAMLRDVGCAGAIVGHSERRALYGETDQLVARKFAAVLAAGLMPILCIGEQLAEREAGRTFEVVDRQLDAVLDLSGVGGICSRSYRLRTRVGHWHGKDGLSAAGGRRACPHPRPDRWPRC